MTLFEDYSTRLEQSEVPILGSLAWYTLSTINELCIPYEDAVRMMKDAGLDGRLPSCPRDHDTFERVSTNAARKRVPSGTPDVFLNLLVRNVGRDETSITRRIVVERVNPAGKRLDYTQVVDVVFDRPTSRITALWRQGSSYSFPDVQVMLDTMQTEYDKWRGNINSYTIREWIRHFMQTLGSISVRNGVYFVMGERNPELHKMEKFVNALPGDCSAHSLPLIDDRKQREMVRAAFEEETASDIDTVMADMQDVFEKVADNSDYMISQKKYLDFLDQYQNLTEKAVQYEELLESGLAITQSRLTIFQETILNLTKHVKM